MSSNFDIETSFPKDVAEAVLVKLQDRFGAEFDKKYPLNGRNPNKYLSDMTQMAREVLDGLTPNDIRNGLRKLNSEEWCPSLPRFRSLCLQGGSWLTEDEAWANALAYIADSDTPITVQVYEALKRIEHVMTYDQKGAGRAFRDVYVRIVANCKENRIPQSQYEPVKLPAPSPEEVKAVPIPADILAQLKTGFKRVNT